MFGLAAVLASPTAAQDKSAFTPAQREQLKTLVRDYLLENPEVIAEAIGKLQEKEEAKKDQERAVTIAMYRQDLVNPKEQTVIGNLQGDATIVEFFDYNCGYCKSMFQGIAELLKEDRSMRLVLKEYPILGPASMTASRAALAARKQGKYAELHLALLSHKGQLSDAVVMDVASKAGLDMKKLENDMKDPAITEVIVRNHNLADELGIDGTPSLIIGDAFVPGAISKDKLVEHISKARK